MHINPVIVSVLCVCGMSMSCVFAVSLCSFTRSGTIQIFSLNLTTVFGAYGIRMVDIS